MLCLKDTYWCIRFFVPSLFNESKHKVTLWLK